VAVLNVLSGSYSSGGHGRVVVVVVVVDVVVDVVVVMVDVVVVVVVVVEASGHLAAHLAFHESYLAVARHWSQAAQLLPRKLQNAPSGHSES